MITIFSIPRDFKNSDTARRQRNALKSWIALTPRPEILLFGDDAGIVETCAGFHVRHIPDVFKNEYGTPRLDGVFKKAREVARHPVLCYVNADILFTDVFLRAITRVMQWRSKFLAVGQRINIDLPEDLDTARPDWARELERTAAEAGKPQPPEGSDYFVFPKNILVNMPPFVVGRPAWDNWMIYYFRKIGVPVVDISRAYKPIHQEHDYSHVPQRRDTPGSGPEGDSNIRLLGYNESIRFFLIDSTHVMDERSIHPQQEKHCLPTRVLHFMALHLPVFCKLMSFPLRLYHAMVDGHGASER